MGHPSGTALRISGSGNLTSSQRYLDIYFSKEKGELVSLLSIESIISDSLYHKVGIRIGSPNSNAIGVLELSGGRSNTFTGNVEVSGSQNQLVLKKTNGAIAIQGDIFVNNHARLSLWGNAQISSRSTVRLRSSTLNFIDDRFDGGFTKKESFHKLVIEGTSFLQFRHGGKWDPRFLYLDDLSVTDGGQLIVQGWEEGIHWLLVRKTSKSIDNALSKIAFDGYLPGRTHKEDYSRDYWAISGTPEPTTYGAILSTVGVGLVVWRRQKQRKRKP